MSSAGTEAEPAIAAGLVVPSMHGLSKYDPSKQDQIKNDQIKNDQIKNDQIKNDQIMNDQIMNDQIVNDQIVNDQIINDQTKYETTKYDQSQYDQSQYDPSQYDPNRYDRQIRFAPIGTDGQRRLRDAAVLVAGVGALGCSLAQQMARAGVGFVRLADRDFVERDNLHRQTLFDENDAAHSAPKAVAAAARLRKLNGEVRIEPHVLDIGPANAPALLAGVDLVLDGTDNAETRLLLSDACFRLGIPFLYGGATGSSASAAALVPGATACLRCLIGGEEDAEPGDTCDTAGIIGPAIEFAASLQAAEALKWLSGRREALRRTWITADVWRLCLRETRLPAGRAACPYCGNRASARGGEASESGTGAAMEATVLCGRSSVQVATGIPMPPADIAPRLSLLGCIIMAANDYLVRAQTPSGAVLAVFGDGRVLVRGTEDPHRAIELCHAYLTGEPGHSLREEEQA